jgi:hypothetical protein
VDADPIVVWYYTLCVSSQSKMAMVHENKDQKPMVLIYLNTKIPILNTKFNKNRKVSRAVL